MRLRRHLLTQCLCVFILILTTLHLTAKEGMWIPATLRDRAKDMKDMGLEIPIDELYNEQGTGLNNAVVLFGRGCTGEVISSRGLVLTNHHCGYGSVQRLSASDKDYFANGFWAMSNKDELPCPGLTVTFIRRMENVTDRILAGISDTLNDKKRDSIVSARITSVQKEFENATHLEALIKPYYDGNQYWVAIMETFRDIRLVGFPPNGIGGFGGDVENWAWPRHTGDFSIFRIYAGADNKPADYSEANKPYNADRSFRLNIAGYKEGDFTMVYGFPGTTREYISSYELKQVYSITDPISISARTRRLDIWTKHMGWSRDIFLKYTSKRFNVANGWKKWQGEVLGLKVNNAMGKKAAYEQEFQQWAKSYQPMPFAASLLPWMKETAADVDTLIYQDQYNKEDVLAIELIQQGAALDKLIACFRAGGFTSQTLPDTLKKLAMGMSGFFKNYDAPTDKDVFVSLMSQYFSKCPNTLPAYFKDQYRAHNQDIAAWATDLYNTSLLTSSDKLIGFVVNATTADSARITQDPAWLLYKAISEARKADILPALTAYYDRMRYLDRLYTKARMEKDKSKALYPDANLTLRLAYGHVKGLNPDGPAPYSWQTTLKDAIALDDSTSDIFKVPAKLKQLYKARDFGRWGVNGNVPLAFVADNHTSGGNSGSPVLNKKGELIGTNFDRAYEGTMSDYYFDPNRCRNISVDIRYTLFIIEKFGGAGWLLDEMSLVK